MATIEMFSSSVNYKYKSKICSLSFLVVLLLIIISLLMPFFIIHNAGGFSLKHSIYSESPDVSFNYKYLLLAYRDYNTNPIVCSSFEAYKHNKIEDDCILIKVLEMDTDNDGKKNNLKFEAHFYADEPIRSLKLLLFFNFHLKSLFEVIIESIALFIHVPNKQEKVQEIEFYGDLILQQKGLLTSRGLYKISNHSLEMADNSLEELLAQNSNRKFAAKIRNKHVREHVGFSNESTVVIQGKLIYRGCSIYFQPNFLEEFKWAWVQYFSYLLVFAYITKHILIFLFSNRHLNCYTVVPWKNK